MRVWLHRIGSGVRRAGCLALCLTTAACGDDGDGGVYIVVDDVPVLSPDASGTGDTPSTLSTDSAAWGDTAGGDTAGGDATAESDAAPLDTGAADAPLTDGLATDAAEVGADSAEPDATEPDATEPDATEPDAAVQDSADPDSTDPDSTDPNSTDPDSTDADAVTPPTIGELCFSEVFDPSFPGPNYDQFEPIVGSHCLGTNHQVIDGIQQVVFLGDSVSVGTPNLAHALPTDNNHFYRNQLATYLRDHFELDDGGFIEFGFWKSYDLINGVAGVKSAGAFSSCAKWGARTDDLLDGGGQIGKCFPDGGSPLRTLVVFTMGGNDVFKITQSGAQASESEVAAGYPAQWALAESTVEYLVEALYWLKDPERFPNGCFVVFANPYEYTDGTNQIDSCPAAPLAGIGGWAQADVLADIVVWINEQFLAAAVETNTDMIWMLEQFCGHGYAATGPNADPTIPCYRGPDAELYFDETCIHPSAPGHSAIYEMFRETILE